MDDKTVFSKNQKKLMIFWLTMVSVLGGYALHFNLIDTSLLFDNLIYFSLTLLSINLIVLALIGSVLGTDLVKRLQQTRGYYSLTTNIYWLVIILFVNLVVGILWGAITKNGYYYLMYTPAKWWINWLALLDLTLVCLFLWYAITRLARMIRALKAREQI